MTQIEQRWKQSREMSLDSYNERTHARSSECMYCYSRTKLPDAIVCQDFQQQDASQTQQLIIVQKTKEKGRSELGTQASTKRELINESTYALWTLAPPEPSISFNNTDRTSIGGFRPKTLARFQRFSLAIPMQGCQGKLSAIEFQTHSP
jgi:hypothetical protein